PQGLDAYYLDVLLSNYYTSGDIGGALDFLRTLNETRGEEEGIQTLIRKYFAVIPPEEQIEFLENRLAEDPDNLEVIQQLFDLLQQEGYRGKMMELAPRLLEMDPTPEILRLLIRMYIEDGEVETAADLFQQLETMPNVTLTAQDLHNMGIALQELERFREAREYYRRALQVDPEYTEALKAIANLYATAVALCGVSDRVQSAVFWLVSDAYQRAGDSANAARYRGAFPTAEDIFYTSDWTEGQTTSVTYTCRGLTISGTTTVRKRR
ncbi:MAG: tetratricopeptide repeat protein, partial [Rhodothermales bacterium]